MIAEGIEPNYWRASTDNDKKESVDAKWKTANENVQIDEVSVNKRKQSGLCFRSTYTEKLCGFQRPSYLCNLCKR